MPKGRLVGVLLTGIVLATMVGVALWVLEREERDTCGVCRRPIHQQSRATIEAGGKKTSVCCARCALTMARQQQKPARIVEVTDYVSNRPIRPDDAFYVEGSRIILCEQHEPLLDSSKHSYDKTFDRCEPSLYAFARRADAENFAREYGGAVVSLPQLMKEMESQP